ncbi:hypothetical protein N5079_29915, partial [Planotetraspora sp. A-T 1434]|uniref:hypothetical protein n=1 Tax=Planotetraspora sp. A-T 1434 TaxID=2979219 RepID=UPI0021C0DC90
GTGSTAPDPRHRIHGTGSRARGSTAQGRGRAGRAEGPSHEAFTFKDFYEPAGTGAQDPAAILA